MIDVTGINLKRFAREVYRLSKPAAKHSIYDSLSDTTMGFVLKGGGMHNWQKFVLDMHAVQGRECNMTVFESKDKKWFINDTWYGHTDEQFEELLNCFNIKRKS